MRRFAIWFTALGALACLVGTSPAAIRAPKYPNATTYQMTAGHDGNVYGTPLRAALRQLWTTDLGGTVSYPVIAGRRVFVTYDHGGAYGTSLIAFNALTGKRAWGPVDLGGDYSVSGISYDGGRVFAVNQSGTVRAFAAGTGRLLWAIQLPPGYESDSPPTALAGTLYISTTGWTGTLVALSETTGRMLWQADAPDGMHGSPAVGLSGVYTAFLCQQVRAFTRSGQALWSHPGCSAGGGRTPVLHGGRVWTREEFVPWLPPQQGVYSANTGTLLSSWDGLSAPAFGAGEMFYESESGCLVGADEKSGAETWHQTGDGLLVSAPVVSGHTVFVGSGSGNVYGFDATTGRQTWHASVHAPVLYPEEHNEFELQGLAIGDGVLAVPASSHLTVFG